MRKDSEESLDEDMLFGTDSDDSFNQDYHIPKQTLRKERIVKRDKQRFEKEKGKREEKRVKKIENEVARKIREEEEERKEMERLKREQAELESKSIDSLTVFFCPLRNPGKGRERQKGRERTQEFY